MLLEFITLISILGAYLYFTISNHYKYWKNRGVPCLKLKFPLGILHERIFGNIPDGVRYQKIYNEFRSQGSKYVGGFVVHQPTLVILDLDIAKSILIKDFNHFVSRDFIPTTHEHISNHLFAMEGQEWREMRTKLTPTFTSGKMKNMFLLMERCAQQLQEYLDTAVLRAGSAGEFKVKDLTARYTTDIIATCAFGLEVNSIKDRENEFYKTGQLIFVPKRYKIILSFILHNIFPKVARFLKFNFYDPRVSDFLTKIMRDTVAYRKENSVNRNDFIDLLLKVKENKSLDDINENSPPVENTVNQGKEKESKGKDQNQLTLEEMTAQAFVFFAAGFETAGSVTSFCLFELAKNPEVQDKLRREIDEVVAKYGGQVTYQVIQDMSYMDQVVNETLRKYASLPFLTRVCTMTFKVPDSDLVIDKGVRVIIPAYAFHHEPEVYPDPHHFDPDRFSESRVRDRHPLSFIPFGDGPRNCIGLRFGRLQVKVGLVAILSKFQLSPAPDTPQTLEIDPYIVFTTAKKPFSLRISRRTAM